MLLSTLLGENIQCFKKVDSQKTVLEDGDEFQIKVPEQEHILYGYIDHVIKNAATIAMLYFALFFCGGLAISISEEIPLLDCLYEAASAVGTVGLTLGITPKLHMFSQIVLIILMYLGRVGGLTLIYAVLSRRNRGNAKLPLEKITVG